MWFLVPVLAAWLVLRLTLLKRQSDHLRRHAGIAPVSHLQARLAAQAVGVGAEAGLLAWLLPGGGLVALGSWFGGLPAALIALFLRAGLWHAIGLYNAIAADARAGKAVVPKMGPYAAGLVLRGLVAALLLGVLPPLLPDHWILAWGVWSLVELGRGWIAPMLVPLLDDGRPLADVPLSRRLRLLLDDCGLGDCRLLEVGGGGANARFAGLPGARSVVLTRPLLAALPSEQVAAVVAHEAGHCRHRHLEIWLLAKLALALAVFAALPHLLALTAWPPVLALAALWLAASCGGYFLRPLPAAARRHWEFQADAFAARHVGAVAMAAALAELDGVNGAPPTADPVHAAFTAFHPSLSQRAARLAGLAADQSAAGAVAEDGAG